MTLRSPLYNLQKDSDETLNVIFENQPEASLLRKHIDEWKKTKQHKFQDKESYKMDEETKKHLQALGYI